MKRKISDFSEDWLVVEDDVQSKAKKPKKENDSKNDDLLDYNEWNSASSVHNYLLDDPILDYFKYKPYFNRTRSFSVSEGLTVTNLPSNKENDFGNFLNCILKKGNEFEKNVMQKIYEKIGLENIKQISFSQYDISCKSKFRETIKEMQKGTPLIYQGVLHSESSNSYGSPDIIIRSDYVNKLSDYITIPEEEIKIETNLSHDYHYRIIDIKYCTLKLKADGEHLSNEGRMKANKGQIIIYNRILGEIQGYVPKTCYVLGRCWNYTSCGKNYFEKQCFSKLGKIDVFGLDNHLNEKVDNALKWLSDLKKNGHTWTLNPPSRPELYPNMCNKNDEPYHSQKADLAHKLKEITSVWNIGHKHRQNAHALGIYRWTDPGLDIETLGMKPGGKTANIVGKMLNFNRDKKSPVIYPKIIENNDYNWQDKPKIEFYIDFEIVNNIFDNMDKLPHIGSDSYVFMIGLVAVINNSRIRIISDPKTQYYSFVSESLSDEGEYKIFDDLHVKIKEICDEVGVLSDDVNFYHWGSIERTTYERILKKYDYPESWFGNIFNFCDFLEVFKKEPILIKGVLKFGLKSVANGFIDNKLIKVEGWGSECTNGLDAMVQANSCYQELETKRLLNPDYSVLNFLKIKNIIKYNKVDCMMIFEIINYLRKHHIHKTSIFEKIKNFFNR